MIGPHLPLRTVLSPTLIRFSGKQDTPSKLSQQNKTAKSENLSNIELKVRELALKRRLKDRKVEKQKQAKAQALQVYQNTKFEPKELGVIEEGVETDFSLLPDPDKDAKSKAFLKQLGLI